jgi:hypothetical protein
LNQLQRRAVSVLPPELAVDGPIAMWRYGDST